MLYVQVLQEAAREKMAAQLAGPGFGSSTPAPTNSSVTPEQGYCLFIMNIDIM